MKERVSTPLLRFGGFSEDWRIVRLGSVLTILNGFAFSSRHAVESGVRWVKIADVGIHKMKKDSLSFLPVGFLRSHSKFILRKGDCVIALTRPILNSRLKIAMIDDEFDGALLNQRVGKLVTSNHLPFIYYLLQQDRLVAIIESNIAGSDPPNLSPNEINDIRVTLPILAEQQKIATFLTAVDNKIQLLEKKKGLLEQYRKGVMQKIFNREIGFKDDDGNECSDWEELELGKISLSVSNGLSIPQNSMKRGVKVTRIETISSRSINLDRVGYVETNENIDDYKLQKGDLLFSNINSVAHIGKVVLVDKDYDLFHGMNLLRIRLDRSKVDPRFIAIQLGSSKYKVRFETICNRAVNQASINQTELRKTRLLVPVYKEQCRIAGFFSSIDNKISQVSRQLELTRQYKKGLLQKMFI